MELHPILYLVGILSLLSKLWGSLHQDLQTKLHFSSTYHPQANE